MISCMGCGCRLSHPVKYCPYCGRPQANDVYVSQDNEHNIFTQLWKKEALFKGCIDSIRFIAASLVLVLVLAACCFLSSMAFGIICMHKSDAFMYQLMAGMVGFFGTFTALCFIYSYYRFLKR